MTPVEQLEQHLAGQKSLVETSQMAQRLYQNSDFKKLIVEGFMLHEAARYAQLSADPALSAEERADALALAQASGHLKRFLSVTVRMGNQAENSISETEEALDEARSEEGHE